ncbi:MAG: HD domain-containing protein [Phycicoccus sp.]|nr:HD domain-containing protein [Phycicoccus sp.]
MRDVVWSVVRARWLVVIPALAMLGIAAAALATPGETAQLARHWQVSVVVILLLTAGGLAQVRVPGGRTSAPVSMATAIGTVCLGAVHGLEPFDVSLTAVCLLVVTGLLLGQVLRWLTHRPLSITRSSARVTGFGVAAILWRTDWGDRGSLWDWQMHPGTSVWAITLAMLGTAATGVLTEIVLNGIVRTRTRGGHRVAVLRDQFSIAPALTLSVVTAGPVAALIAPVLGVASFAVALIPMVVTHVAVRQFVANRETHRSTILTMSRLTERSGHTMPGHPERVAEISVTLGRRLGLSDRELRELEFAALLHDVGQLTLVEPIPAGATVLVAPQDQRLIAHAGAMIVARTPGMRPVANLVEEQSVPFRDVREDRTDVALGARIIRVANAFEDFTEGSRSPRDVDYALERLTLGLGYEYDPEVVDELTEVVQEDQATAAGAR